MHLLHRSAAEEMACGCSSSVVSLARVGWAGACVYTAVYTAVYTTASSADLHERRDVRRDLAPRRARQLTAAVALLNTFSTRIAAAAAFSIRSAAAAAFSIAIAAAAAFSIRIAAAAALSRGIAAAVAFSIGSLQLQATWYTPLSPCAAHLQSRRREPCHFC